MAERQTEPSVTLPPEGNGSFGWVDAKTGGVAVLNTIAGPTRTRYLRWTTLALPPTRSRCASTGWVQ